MNLWKRVTEMTITKKLRFLAGAVLDVNGTEINLVELAALNNLAAADLQKIDGITDGTAAAGKALVLSATGGISGFRYTGGNLYFTQAAPAAKTVATTLTAAEILAGLLTANQGGAAAANYTLPLATDLETAFAAAVPGGVLANNDSFDFTLINISAVAAEDITIVTNTGWTLVGNMVVESNEATAQKGPVGTFRARRTAANTFTLYRVS